MILLLPTQKFARLPCWVYDRNLEGWEWTHPLGEICEHLSFNVHIIDFLQPNEETERKVLGSNSGRDTMYLTEVLCNSIRPAFLNLWSADHQWSAMMGQVVRKQT
jgi:hypothetical protein